MGEGGWVRKVWIISTNTYLLNTANGVLRPGFSSAITPDKQIDLEGTFVWQSDDYLLEGEGEVETHSLSRETEKTYYIFELL